MKNELIIRGLLSLLGIWFLYRFISPLFSHYFLEFFSGDRKKKKNVDMDILIRRQENLLRKGMSGVAPSERETAKGKRNKCLEHYQLEFTKGNSSAKKILSLLDEIQWGDGKNLKEIKKLVHKKIGIDWSTSALGKKLELIVEREFPLIPKKPMTFEKIIETLQIMVFLETLDNQSKVRRGSILDFMANRSMLNPIDIALGYEAWNFDLMGKTRSQYLKKLATHSALDNSQLDTAYDKFERKVIHHAIDSNENYLDWAKNQIQIFSELIASIKPVSPIDNKGSLEDACKILGVSPKIPTENLKKIYKKQAKLRHPDTLKGKNIPEEFEAKAMENFVRIKTAYEIVLKSK